ncbi:MAG: hypothetical protein C3F19_17075 [Rhodocyclales bacterium]|jgi:hypothetical protein|nr:hypothetical protein [Rhodocyclaceae bacterium]PWB39196.1 MAG: hypothetical protein C3F19_17075 [Rhodocyclales bacterium]
METQIYSRATEVAKTDTVKYVTAGSEPNTRIERLPFTVRIAKCDEDLAKAVSIRHQAYARHLPAVAATLDRPEELDRCEDSVVVLAESKLDGTPVGTMRIQRNSNRALVLEESIDLPAWLQGRSMIEITRFGVAEGRMGMLVRTVLVKAGFQYCLLSDIDWIVIAARAPLDTLWEKLLFQDVFPGFGLIPMRHAGNIPHRVLAFDVSSAYERWTAARHSLLDFMCNTHHPDLRLAERDEATRSAVARLPEIYRSSGLNPLACLP